MKVCKMGLESIWVNGANGSIKVCGWTDYYLGNLTECSIEELWHGEKAEEFRRSMLDGSYRYCLKDSCPYCANGTRDSLMVEYNVPDYPKTCSFSYEQACNYVCKFCRTKKYIPEKDEGRKILHIENELNKFANKLEVLSSNGVGELFCSPSIIKILGGLEYNKNLKVKLESNGSLFNEKNWSKISNLGRHNLSVYITVHSFEERTYQFLSGTNLPISNIIHNLYFLRGLREKEIINHFEIATVICERNFWQMPEFVDYSLREFNPDKIRLRFFEPYGVRNRAIEWFYDVRNPYHPYYEEFIKVMKDPIFNNPKVWKWQGEYLSKLGEHPYFAEQNKVKMLSNLETMDDLEKRVKNYLEKNDIKRLALYGYGDVGKAVSKIFERNNIIVDFIFDSHISEEKAELSRNKVSKPCKELVKNCDMIVITSMAHDDIKNTLLNLKYSGYIVSLYDFIKELDVCI